MKVKLSSWVGIILQVWKSLAIFSGFWRERVRERTNLLPRALGMTNFPLWGLILTIRTRSLSVKPYLVISVGMNKPERISCDR